MSTCNLALPPGFEPELQVPQTRVLTITLRQRGAPGEIRTPNLRFRRPQLYPVELRRR